MTLLRTKSQIYIAPIDKYTTCSVYKQGSCYIFRIADLNDKPNDKPVAYTINNIADLSEWFDRGLIDNGVANVSTLIVQGFGLTYHGPQGVKAA